MINKFNMRYLNDKEKCRATSKSKKIKLFIKSNKKY